MRGAARAWAVAVLAALPTVAAAQDVQVAAAFGRRQVLPGEIVTYTITVSSQSLARGRKLPEPDFSAFDVLQGPSVSRSSQLSVVNGSMTQREIHHYSWRLLPRGEGTLSIPAFSMEVNGAARPVPQAQIQVASPLPGMQAPPDPAGQGVPRTRPPAPQEDPRARADGSRPWTAGAARRGLQLDVEVEDRAPYVGQEIVVAHVLSFDENVKSFGERGAAEFPGFSKSRHEDVPTESRAVRDPETGRVTHSEARLARWTLVPLGPGEKTLPAHAYVFTLPGRDPLEQFFGNERQVQASTPPATIRVRPLPEGAPASFTGAVGSFQLAARLENEQLRAGDATALVLEVRGRGSLDGVAPPELVLPQGLKSFAPEVTQDVRRGTDGHSEGVKRFRYPLLVGEAGRKEIGPLAWSFFDPRTGRYVERIAGPLVVDAAPGEGPAMAPIAGPAAQSPLVVQGTDIRHLRTALGDWSPDLGFAPLPRWAWLAVAAGPALNLLMGAGLLARRLRPVDAATRRAQGAARRARRLLAEARAAAKAGRRTEAADRAARAVAGFLSDRLALGAEPAPAEAGRALAAAGMPDVAARAEVFLGDCDFVRFASGGTDADAARLVERAEALLAEMASLRAARPAP